MSTESVNLRSARHRLSAAEDEVAAAQLRVIRAQIELKEAQARESLPDCTYIRSSGEPCVSKALISVSIPAAAPVLVCRAHLIHLVTRLWEAQPNRLIVLDQVADGTSEAS